MKKTLLLTILTFLLVNFAIATDNLLVQADEFEEFQEFDNSEHFQDLDEFQEFEEDSSFETQDARENVNKGGKVCPKTQRQRALFWVLGILLVAIIAGVLASFRSTRKLKPLFLLGSIVLIGFIKGACPCMISSFIDFWLAIFGEKTDWINFLWFLGLIPITYIFGQIWCGWICHLGALQEFIFASSKFEFLKSQKSQIVLRYLQILLTIALIVQLLTTRTNIFCKIDPFLVAFNLFSANATGYVLLILLLFSSLFIYRPFCRGACPIGLILGWVSKLPGARSIKENEDCIGCSVCQETCKQQAIKRFETEEEGVYKIEFDHQNCNFCGECFDVCDKNAIKFIRNPKKTKGKNEPK